VMLYP